VGNFFSIKREDHMKSFKNIVMYNIEPTKPQVKEKLEHALDRCPFVPTAPTQQKSQGWVPPRGHAHGALLEAVNGHYILALQTEVRTVPSQTLALEVEAQAQLIEHETGRKPGRSVLRDIREQALLKLLPDAFPKQSRTFVWINPLLKLIVVGASSVQRADDAVTMLCREIEGFAISRVHTEMKPATLMACWLAEGTPDYDEFTLGRDCELVSCDESKSVVRYAKHPLDVPEVSERIKQGMWPRTLSLTWRDRISFMLTDQLQLKKLALLDVVFETNAAKKNKPATDEAFDADVAIFTGEMHKLLPELIAALN
jgi:recombination associated protein RdgC